MITIIDYKAGNLTSVRLAFESLGAKVLVTDQPEIIAKAKQLVFPGVGAAGSAMQSLRELGLLDAIKQSVNNGVPFLGICIGMQLMLDSSEEDNTACLGIIPGQVKLFKPSDRRDKIPQMGWNTVKLCSTHPLFAKVEDESEFYFVHSYYCQPDNKSDIVGETEYADINFASAVGRDNFFATQFHIERSGRIGLKIFENFLGWDGSC
jgi:imidazole glycerol-phosphate synthase subunit HisH